MMQEIESHELWSCLEGSDFDFKYEENATFWLWAYPSLLDWPLKTEWLFSPVVGKTEYPGDLWGIDEAGNLLLIETKRGNKRSDPFEDFIAFQKNQKWKTSASTEKILTRWQKLYRCELEFWNKYNTALAERTFKLIFARGIVPYSSKRYATLYWSELYLRVIAPHLFGTNSYVENVKTFLERRNRSNLATILYFGLVFVEETNSALLSAKGETHYKELRTLAGEENTRLIRMTAHPSPDEQCVKITAQTF